MTRRKIKKEPEVVVDIISTIDSYGEEKQKESNLKKIITSLSNEIKSYFLKNGLNEFSGDKYTATVSTTTKTTMNDDIAIQILKDNLDDVALRTVIKTKEYIDEDALEKLVYANEFDMSLLERALVQKQTSVLRINKKK